MFEIGDTRQCHPPQLRQQQLVARSFTIVKTHWTIQFVLTTSKGQKTPLILLPKMETMSQQCSTLLKQNLTLLKNCSTCSIRQCYFDIIAGVDKVLLLNVYSSGSEHRYETESHHIRNTVDDAQLTWQSRRCSSSENLVSMNSIVSAMPAWSTPTIDGW